MPSRCHVSVDLMQVAACMLDLPVRKAGAEATCPRKPPLAFGACRSGAASRARSASPASPRETAGMLEARCSAAAPRRPWVRPQPPKRLGTVCPRGKLKCVAPPDRRALGRFRHSGFLCRWCQPMRPALFRTLRPEAFLGEKRRKSHAVAAKGANSASGWDKPAIELRERWFSVDLDQVDTVEIWCVV